MGTTVEVGDALVLHAPFVPPTRVHCKSVLSVPRGSIASRFTFGIDALESVEPRQLLGAFVTLEGLSVRAFTARLRPAHPPGRFVARFDLEGDRAWGLASITHGLVNLAVVGGGLGERDLWSALLSVKLAEAGTILRDSFEPVLDDESLGLWQLPTLTTYATDDDLEALVVPAAGPVYFAEGALKRSNRWESTAVMQQPGGLTHLFVRPTMGTTSSVTVPFLNAA